MSHWLKAKLKNKCSLSSLNTVLGELMPEWRKHIKIDPAGKLDAHNYYQNFEKTRVKHGYSLVITLGAEGRGGGDIGFKKLEDGSWQVDYEGMVLPPDMTKYGVGSVIAAELAAKRAKAEAKHFGNAIDGDSVVGGKRVIRTLIPIGNMPTAQAQ